MHPKMEKKTNNIHQGRDPSLISPEDRQKLLQDFLDLVKSAIIEIPQCSQPTVKEQDTVDWMDLLIGQHHHRQKNEPNTVKSQSQMIADRIIPWCNWPLKIAKNKLPRFSSHSAHANVWKLYLTPPSSWDYCPLACFPQCMCVCVSYVWLNFAAKSASNFSGNSWLLLCLSYHIAGPRQPSAWWWHETFVCSHTPEFSANQFVTGLNVRFNDNQKNLTGQWQLTTI